MPPRRDYYPLTKRYRIDTVRVPFVGEAGIYVVPSSGEFYARVPEADGGTLLRHGIKRELVKLVEAALKDCKALHFEHVIRVTYANPMKYSGASGSIRGYSGMGGRWRPDDPMTASDVVGPLLFTVVDVATRANGSKVYRIPAPAGAPASWPEKIEEWDAAMQAHDEAVELPWSAELEEALRSFQQRIQALDHNIRTMLQQPDVGALLLKAGAGKLLTAPVDGGQEDRP